MIIFVYLMQAPTCSGRCEETTEDPTYPCQCDEGCYARGDCCDDYANLCRRKLIFFTDFASCHKSHGATRDQEKVESVFFSGRG